MAAGVSTTTSSNCTNGGNTQNRGDYSCWEVKTQKVNFKNRLALVLSMDLHARFSFFGFFFFLLSGVPVRPGKSVKSMISPWTYIIYICRSMVPATSSVPPRRLTLVAVSVFFSVCVCVWERERGRERECVRACVRVCVCRVRACICEPVWPSGKALGW